MCDALWQEHTQTIMELKKKNSKKYERKKNINDLKKRKKKAVLTFSQQPPAFEP